jgi:hypothetical protein
MVIGREKRFDPTVGTVVSPQSRLDTLVCCEQRLLIT